MNIHKLVLGLSFVLFGALGVQAAPALKVLSAAPKGQQDEMGRQAVNVHFNQPVVKLGEQTQFAAADCPLTIAPKIDGTCRYSGTQTLVFEPTENWSQATKYTVTVPKGFTSSVSGQKLAAAYQFSFITQVPRVLSVLPYKNEHWISLNPTVYVFLSQPVDLSRAAQFIKLTVPQGKTMHTIPVSVRVPTQEELDKNFSYLSAEEKKKVFALNPTETLQAGKHYTVTLQAGLPGKTGTAGMAQKYETSFFTFPPLTVQKVTSTGCLPFTPSVHFSSPVRKRELWNYVETFPAYTKIALNDREKESLGDEVTNPKTGEAYFKMPLDFISIKPQEPVQVTIRKGLRDIYGNVLEKDEHFTIENNGYCPAVDFSAEGFGVLESYLPAHLPIALMNMPALFIESARFNRDNFIPFQEKRTSYCAKKPLTGATFSGEYAFKDVKDKTLRTYIDLARFAPTATDSIIFSQFKTKRSWDNSDCWISATDNLTDIGISFKTSAQDILIWTTSLQTGQPLGGLAVELRNRDNKVVWTGTTDANGLARAPGWDKLEVPAREWGQPSLYAFITSPKGDAVVSNLWNDGLEPWRFNINYEYTPVAQALKSYMFADRGVYRPGETVYLKGVVRQQVNGVWKLPSVVRGTLTLNDSHGTEVIKKDVTISSAYGSFDFKFELPQTATTGYWDARFAIQIPGKEVPDTFASFQVEEVKPADFNVFIKPNMPNYIGGEEATFSAAAQYYFGAPLAAANAKWNLRQENTWFTPKGYEQYTFTPYFLQRNQENENGKLLLNASGQLDSRGALLFAAKMPRMELPVRVYAEIDIESPAHQNLFKRTSVMVHPADIYVGAKTLKDAYEQGQPVQLHVVAVTPEGQPAETTATAEIYREEYYSVRKVGLAGRLEWVSEKKVTSLSTQTLRIGKKGASLTFIAQEAGSYYIKLTAKDLFGRTVQGGIDVYVHGEGQSYVQRTADDLLKLTQNKNEYKVGQTARIRVQSPYANAYALVTVEREGILDAWTTVLKGGENTLSIPIKDTYLPNAYVSVLLVQGRTAKPATAKEDLGKPQGKIGYVNLNVVPDGKRIVTTLKTNAKKYVPGEQATISLNTKVRGKGVPAEVVVMVVDEGVLALSDYQMPDLFSLFYGSAPLSVFTMDNRSYVIGQRNLGEKGENRGGSGNMLAASKLAGTDLRSRFLFTPYYASVVQTDAKGRATVSFTLPDNLTTFRIMAISLRESEFGSAQHKITVSKPVMVTPSLPRFAREGDQFNCGAIVYNYEDEKGKFTVEAEASGQITLNGPSTQEVSVPKGQSREVMWKCRAGKSGNATVAFAAKGRYSDGVQTELKVSTPEKEQHLAVYGTTQTTQDEMIEEPLSLNTSAANRVTFSLASTAMLQLKGAMSYLLTYPYNCLEQQLSKIVPVVFAPQLVKDFKLADVANLRKTAQQVLTNLGAYQSPDGGFGYWSKSLPDPYVTAYVLDVSLQAKQTGLDVPTQVIDKAVSWLERAQHPQQAYAYSTEQTDTVRAYSAYVLARYGKNTDSLFNTLYAKRIGLSSTAVAYLLQAAQVAGRSQTIKQALAEQLTNKMVYLPTGAYVEAGKNLVYLHENNISATAHALQALLAAHRAPDNAYQMVTWLVRQLNAQGNWNDTHTNAAVVRALQAYYMAHESAVPNFTATVKQADAVRLTASFAGRSVKEETATLPFAQVYTDGSAARIAFAKQGTGTLYYTLGQHYTPASYNTAVDAGFSITRTFSTLDGKPATEILVGERYKVTLHIKTAVSRTFVAAEDYIPAGFTLVNTTLATESATQADLLAQDNTAFTHTEQYEDRIYGFAGELPAGTHRFSYLVTAIASGTYTYPAAWVSQMYEPEVFGRNTTSVLVIK